LQFAFKNGAVRDFNKAKVMLKGQTVAADSSPDQTEFSELTGITGSPTGLVAGLEKLSGSTVPVRISGPFA